MSYVTLWSLLGDSEFCEGAYFKFPVRKEASYSINAEVSGVPEKQVFNNYQKDYMLARYVRNSGLADLEFLSEASEEEISLKGIKACSFCNDILKKHCEELYDLLEKGIVTEPLRREEVKHIEAEFLPKETCWIGDFFINMDKRNKIENMGMMELKKKKVEEEILYDSNGDRIPISKHICFKYKLSAMNKHIKVQVDDEHNGSRERPYELIFD